MKRFVPSFSISFKCECYIIMQMKHTKNLNPERSELGKTLSQPNRSISKQMGEASYFGRKLTGHTGCSNCCCYQITQKVQFVYFILNVATFGDSFNSFGTFDHRKGPMCLMECCSIIAYSIIAAYSKVTTLERMSGIFPCKQIRNTSWCQPILAPCTSAVQYPKGAYCIAFAIQHFLIVLRLTHSWTRHSSEVPPLYPFKLSVIRIFAKVPH